jgi:hypothetical protein
MTFFSSNKSVTQLSEAPHLTSTDGASPESSRTLPSPPEAGYFRPSRPLGFYINPDLDNLIDNDSRAYIRGNQPELVSNLPVLPGSGRKVEAVD